MKYLKVFESFFKDWEEISDKDWYDSNYVNQPFDETEYDTLVNFCIDNAKFKKGEQEYELDYDYTNPNKMGYGFHSGGRSWRFSILRFSNLYDDDDVEWYKAQDRMLILFKKKEKGDSNSLYFFGCENPSIGEWKFYESDTFDSLMDLVKKHLEL
jgi:hypothetical protein